MDGLNQSLLNVCLILTAIGVGHTALMLVRAGIDYQNSRGNPRNRSQAYESFIDTLKGVPLIVGGPAIAALVFATIRF